MRAHHVKHGIGLLGAVLGIVAVTFGDLSDKRGIVEISFPQTAELNTAAARSRILAETANREAAEQASAAIVKAVELELDIRLGDPTDGSMVASR